MKTDYIPNKLFAEPSFLEGFASVIDLGGVLHKDYNKSKTGEAADKEALQNDWRAVGQDLKSAIYEYEQTSTSTRK